MPRRKLGLNRARTALVAFATTPEFKVVIEKQAASMDCSVSQYLRVLVKRDVQRAAGQKAA